MLLGREKTREKDRIKERKKRGNRKYGQARLKHARKGIISCMAAALVAVIVLLLIISAFLKKGHLTAIVGSFGIFAVILAIIGMYNGIRGFKEREKNYLTCKVGIGVNGAFLGILIGIFVRGLM